LRRRSVVKVWRCYRARLKAYAAGTISMRQVHATVHGWIGHSKQGSTVGLRKAVLALPIPKVVRG
jgi:hypothetical protein